MNDSLLRTAFLISTCLHVGVLVLGPVHSAVEGPPAIRLQIIAVPAQVELPTPMPDAPIVAAPEPDTITSEPEAPLPPEPLFDAARPDEETTLPAVSPPPGNEGDVFFPEVSRREEAALPMDPAARTPGDEAERVDPEAVSELLKEMVAEEHTRRAVERYRFLVRETVFRALQAHDPGAERYRGHEHDYRFLLSFRIDREGYLFDLSLRAPPTTQLDIATLRATITGLSPFPPPPAGASIPFPFLHRVSYQ